MAAPLFLGLKFRAEPIVSRPVSLQLPPRNQVRWILTVCRLTLTFSGTPAGMVFILDKSKGSYQGIRI